MAEGAIMQDMPKSTPTTQVQQRGQISSPQSPREAAEAHIRKNYSDEEPIVEARLQAYSQHNDFGF
jgi:hypothetical protein